MDVVAELEEFIKGAETLRDTGSWNGTGRQQEIVNNQLVILKVLRELLKQVQK